MILGGMTTEGAVRPAVSETREGTMREDTNGPRRRLNMGKSSQSVVGPLEPSVRAKLVAGIAAYDHEQRVFVRLLRKRGVFTEREFDAWFRGREWRRPMRRFSAVTGDTFILGMGRNGGNLWAEMLELLQTMMWLGIIDAKKKSGVGVVYSLQTLP